MDASLLTQVSSVSGVKVASPLIQRYTVMYAGEKRVQLIALGVDPQADRAVHDYRIVAGQPLDEAKGILLESAFAKSLSIKLDDQVELQTRRGFVRAQVIGLYSSQKSAIAGEGADMLMPLSAAQYIFVAPNRFDSIQLVLQPDADEATVRRELSQVLLQGVTVQKPPTRSPIAEQTSLSTEIGLNMARTFALVVALFIIANTFAINVTQQRHSLGIMRAIGATRRQIGAILLSEALILGVVGTSLGCAAGLPIAHVLSQAMGALYSTTLPPIQLHWEPLLYAALLGIGVSLAGAFVPAYKAGSLSPLEVMRETMTAEFTRMISAFAGFGVVLILSSAALIYFTLAGSIPPTAVVWEAIVLLIGLVLMIPIALGPLSKSAAAVFSLWMPAESLLAQRQILEHRGRTMLTSGVVFIAVGMEFGLANAITDNVQDVKDWYHKSVVADFFVRAMDPSMATGLAADLPDNLNAEIRDIPGITSIGALRLVHARTADNTVVLVARDFPDNQPLDLDIEGTNPDQVRRLLEQGEVVVGSVLAQQKKWKVGNDIALSLGGQTQQFRIAAIANDYEAGGLTVYMERNLAKRLFGVDGIDAYLIKVNPARLDEVKNRLQTLCDRYGLLLQSFSDIQRAIDIMMSGVVAGLWGLVVLGLIAAAFGIANTLVITVLEQTREFGLLRIIAMTRWQIRKSILAQALIMGMLALVPGIMAGIGIAYLLHRVTLQVTGHPVPFGLHLGLQAVGFAAGLLVVMLAAWLPAERAARLELCAAIRAD